MMLVMAELITVSIICVLLAGGCVWLWFERTRALKQLAEQAHTVQQAGVVASQQQAKAAAHEAELQQTLTSVKAQLDIAFRAPHDVLYNLDIQTGVIRWGSALYEQYGYQPEAVDTTVEWWTSHIHPDDSMQVNDTLDALLQPKATSWTIDYRFQKADGSFVSVRDRAFILRNEKGESTHLLGAMHVLGEPSAAKPTAAV